MRAFSWDISADAATLAVGSYNVTLFDAATLERSPTQLESWPGYGDTRFVRFGDDDQWLSGASGNADDSQAVARVNEGGRDGSWPCWATRYSWGVSTDGETHHHRSASSSREGSEHR